MVQDRKRRVAQVVDSVQVSAQVRIILYQVEWRMAVPQLNNQMRMEKKIDELPSLFERLLDESQRMVQ